MNRISVFFSAILLAVIINGCKDTTTTPTPLPTHAFTFKVGDRAKYQNFTLDSAGGVNIISRYISYRTIIKLNVPIGGQTDAAMALDSIYKPDNSFDRVDTNYFRVSGSDLYMYNFGKTIAKVMPTTMNPRYTSGWMEMADMSSTAGDYTGDNIQMTITYLGNDIPVPLTMNGSNKGVADLVVLNGPTWKGFQQACTMKSNILGTPINIPVDFYIGGVIGANNSPSAILSYKVASTVLPIVNISMPGVMQSLLEFTAGQ